MKIASIEDINGWLKEAKKKRCTHLMVVCDDFDYEDYPVFITTGINIRKEYENRNREVMQRVVEVYNLSMDIEKQLKERGVIHF